jgi:hypothetical protein
MNTNTTASAATEGLLVHSYRGTIGGTISAIALALGAVELFAIDLEPTLTIAVLQLWFLATGVWLLARGKSLSNS